MRHQQPGEKERESERSKDGRWSWTRKYEERKGEKTDREKKKRKKK